MELPEEHERLAKEAQSLGLLAKSEVDAAQSEQHVRLSMTLPERTKQRERLELLGDRGVVQCGEIAAAQLLPGRKEGLGTGQGSIPLCGGTQGLDDDPVRPGGCPRIGS